MTVDRSRALVIGHADFAAGLVSAVQGITGEGKVLVPLSNATLGREEIEDMLAAALESTGVKLVFTDLPAGSASNAARRLQRVRSDIVIVAGANLAMLLDFVQHPERDVTEAAERAVEKGRAGITLFGGSLVR
jgi:N-acetylgalactosamine PTS system EIIA component